MKNAIDIAKAFLKLSQPEAGDTISNLKLQKLLYYAQGFHLAIYEGKPLFEEDIIAWSYGPVVREVYDVFNEFGSGVIPVPDETIELTEQEKELVGEVWGVYGQFSALKLMEMTHEEMPWMTTERNSIISHEKLQEFFKDLVV